MDLNMEERQPSTDRKSILDFFAKENILDWCDTGKTILEDLPKETILEELAKIDDKSFNDEIYDLS